MTVITIPKPLHDKLGENASFSLVEVLEKIEENSTAKTLERVEDRFERRLTEEISGLRIEMHEGFGKLRAEMHEEFGKLRVEMHEEIGKLRAEMHDIKNHFEQRLTEEISGLRVEMHEEFGKLRAEMHGMRADIIRWMFIFWMGQMLSITAILFTLLKFMK